MYANGEKNVVPRNSIAHKTHDTAFRSVHKKGSFKNLQDFFLFTSRPQREKKKMILSISFMSFMGRESHVCPHRTNLQTWGSRAGVTFSIKVATSRIHACTLEICFLFVCFTFNSHKNLIVALRETESLMEKGKCYIKAALVQALTIGQKTEIRMKWRSNTTENQQCPQCSNGVKEKQMLAMRKLNQEHATN